MLKNLGIILLNIAIMALIVFGFTYFWVPGWLNGLTGHGNQVVVPSVIGLPVDEAIENIEAEGLNPMVIDTVYSDGVEPGAVIEQLPEGNLPVKPHRLVYLTINAFDVQKVAFPDVIQWSSRQAQSHLRELRFVADSIVYEPYEFDDLVLRVKSVNDRELMQVGELYPIRTHLILYVGSTSAVVEGTNEESEETFFE